MQLSNIDNTSIELQTLENLESLTKALILTAEDPVVIERKRFSIYGGDKQRGYFFTEKEGENIMKNRIRINGDDILRSCCLHEEILRKLNEIENFLVIRGRKKVSNLIIELTNNLLKYAKLVEQNRSKIIGGGFLFYPVSLSSKFLYDLDSTSVTRIEENVLYVEFKTDREVMEGRTEGFNLDGGYTGMLSEVKNLKLLAEEFRKSKGRIYRDKSDSRIEYTKSIYKTKEYLKGHFGFDIKELTRLK